MVVCFMPEIEKYYNISKYIVHNAQCIVHFGHNLIYNITFNLVLFLCNSTVFESPFEMEIHTI